MDAMPGLAHDVSCYVIEELKRRCKEAKDE